MQIYLEISLQDHLFLSHINATGSKIHVKCTLITIMVREKIFLNLQNTNTVKNRNHIGPLLCLLKVAKPWGNAFTTSNNKTHL